MKNAHRSKPVILVIGSANIDLTITTPRLPRPGETVGGGKFTTTAGGKGANQAVAAARAGGLVRFVARVGTDAFGRQSLDSLAGAGVNIRAVFQTPRDPTGVALIVVGENGENSIAVAPGANDALTPNDVRKSAPAFEGADALLLQMEVPPATVEFAARTAAARGIPVILNPAPADRVTGVLLRHVSILTPNESEAAALTNLPIDSLETAGQAAARLAARGPKSVIITLGARGALVWSEGQSTHIPGHNVKPVDTTAAGDIFNGALAVGLAEGLPLTEAVRFANAAAAISVTRRGAQSSAPTRREIERFLRRNRSVAGSRPSAPCKKRTPPNVAKTPAYL